MSRGITATVQTEVDKSALSPILLIELMFDTLPLRFWTGFGDLSWDSKTWNGSGDVIKVSPLDETARVEASGVQFQIAGVDTLFTTYALAEDIQGREANVYVGFVDTSGAVLADPVGPFQYLMDTFNISDDPDNVVITLTAESYLASLQRPRPRRYTHEDQQIEFPGDMGLEFVASIQQKEITWGRT